MVIYSKEQQYFIEELRSLLTMRSQAASGSSYKLASILGDDELFQDLRLGLNYYNTLPPYLCTYSFKTLYSANAQQENLENTEVTAPETENYESILITPVIMCSAFFTGLRLQWFEAGKHFRYNDNGISIERAKQQDYSSIVGGNILQYISQTLPMVKRMAGFKQVRIKGQFSGMVGMPRSLTRGLRGTRTGFR
jgi:hypothetical protein